MLSRLDDSVARKSLSPQRRKPAPREIRAGPTERGGGGGRGAGGVAGRPAVNRALHFSRFPAQVVSPSPVYEPYIRALLGIASHLCEVVVLNLRTLPIMTPVRGDILNQLHQSCVEFRVQDFLNPAP